VNGKHGDHPIADLIVHHLAIYGEPLDSRLLELGRLMSYQGLCHWFQPHLSKPAAQLEPLVTDKLEQM